MNTEHCRIFVTAVQMKNVSHAAQKLGYTQSGVSKTIRRLEAEFGFPLVRREHDGISLLPAGQPVYEKMLALLAAQEDLDKEVCRIRNQYSVRIQIVTFHTAATRILPDFIQKFMEEVPEAEFRVKERSRYSYIRNELLDGTSHLGFITEEDADGLEFFPLLINPYYVIVPKGHPLCDRTAVSIQELKQYPVILPDETACSKDLKEAVKKDRLSSHKLQMKILDDSITISLVAKGVGISFVPGLYLSGEEKDIVAIPFEEGYARKIGIACSDRRILTRMEQRFLDFLLRDKIQVI